MSQLRVCQAIANQAFNLLSDESASTIEGAFLMVLADRARDEAEQKQQKQVAAVAAASSSSRRGSPSRRGSMRPGMAAARYMPMSRVQQPTPKLPTTEDDVYDYRDVQIFQAMLDNASFYGGYELAFTSKPASKPISVLEALNGNVAYIIRAHKDGDRSDPVKLTKSTATAFLNRMHDDWQEMDEDDPDEFALNIKNIDGPAAQEMLQSFSSEL